MLSNINEKNLPMAGLHPGDIIMLEIDGYTHDGQGVGRMNGAVVFVRGALQGELVQAEIKRERRGVFYADLLAVLQASGQRQEPDCPVYASCGGCHLQHMSYAEELNFKQQQVQAALQRLAGLQVECRPPLPASRFIIIATRVFFTSAGRRVGCSWVFGMRLRTNRPGRPASCFFRHP